MIVYEKKTKKDRDSVKEVAKQFFGPNGVGLHIAEENECCLSFDGGGGFVNVSITAEDEKERTIEVESREWDHQAKQFVGSL